MKRYIGMRLVYLLITLFVITTATFFLMKQLPGTPFDEEKLNRLPVEERQLLYASYGLDRSRCTFNMCATWRTSFKAILVLLLPIKTCPSRTLS